MSPLLLQPFYGSLDFVRDNTGEPVSEETVTHSHLSWSSIVHYLLPPGDVSSWKHIAEAVHSLANWLPYHQNNSVKALKENSKMID